MLEFDAAVSVREVFEIARALASEPIPGDEGAAFDEKMVSVFLTGVTAHLGASGFVRHGTPGALPAVAPQLRTPFASALESGKAPVPPTRTERGAATARASQTSQAMMQVQMMRIAVRDESVGDLLTRLDPAVESSGTRAIVDDVTRATEDLAAQGKWEAVVQVLDRLHQNYECLHDGDAKRAFLMGIRRLERPTVLQGVARLIPGHRELRETCVRLLNPAVQAALLSALGAAPTEDGVARLVRAAEAGGMLVRKPAALRLRAIEALAEAGTPAARHALQGLQADRDREIRAAVEHAVGRMSA
jgi:hypothetical protein